LKANSTVEEYAQSDHCIFIRRCQLRPSCFCLYK